MTEKTVTTIQDENEVWIGGTKNYFLQRGSSFTSVLETFHEKGGFRKGEIKTNMWVITVLKKSLDMVRG